MLDVYAKLTDIDVMVTSISDDLKPSVYVVRGRNSENKARVDHFAPILLYKDHYQYIAGRWTEDLYASLFDTQGEILYETKVYLPTISAKGAKTVKETRAMAATNPYFKVDMEQESGVRSNI